MNDIIEKIKTKFIGERLFFLKFQPFCWVGEDTDISPIVARMKCSKTGMCFPTDATICPR